MDKCDKLIDSSTVQRIEQQFFSFQKLDKEEALYGMRRIDVNKVPLPDKVTDEDQLIVKLSIDDRQRWDFIKDPHNPDEEYDACVSITLYNIILDMSMTF